MGVKRDSIVVVYARLKALRENLPEGTHHAAALGSRVVPSTWANEFHDILTSLEQASMVDLTTFRFRNCGQFWHDRGLLAARIDAVLGFFEIQSATPKAQIGFRPE